MTIFHPEPSFIRRRAGRFNMAGGPACEEEMRMTLPAAEEKGGLLMLHATNTQPSEFRLVTNYL